MSEGGRKFSELPKKLSFLNKPMPKIFSSIDTRQDEDSGEGANLPGSRTASAASVPMSLAGVPLLLNNLSASSLPSITRPKSTWDLQNESVESQILWLEIKVLLQRQKKMV